MLAVCQGPVLGGDPAFTSKQAKSAKRDFERAIKAATKSFKSDAVEAQEEYRKLLRRALKSGMRDGDLEGAKRTQATIDWLEKALAATEEGNLEQRWLVDHSELSHADALDAQADYSKRIEVAQAAFQRKRLTVLKKYKKKLQKALKSAMRSADLPEAERVKATLEDVQARIDGTAAKKDWLVIFRSADPADWNTLINETERFAIPLVRAPRDMRYVRMRRMDTKESVILAVSFAELAKDNTSGQHCWWGGKVVNEGGVHLGIDNSEWKLTFRDGGRIMVGNRSTAGWGFGHKVHANDTQYWSWAGKEIPMVVFEVSVLSRDLSEEEKALLLE
jgi:hypothetical protein